MTATSTAPKAVDATLYHEIQQFYVRQMHAGDGGDFAAWAASFTEDGVFVSNGLPDPITGRAAIDAATRAGATARAARGATHRHVVTMLDVRLRDGDVGDSVGDSVDTVSYVLVIEAVQGGETFLHVSTVCADHLVRRDGAWLVRRRQVTRDDLPSAQAAA
jgi:bifunctional aromatase (cyclase/dehydratase)